MGLDSVKDDEPSFSAEASLAGAANKVMMGIFNPASSARIISVHFYAIYVPLSSGILTPQIIHWEARRSNAQSAGTNLSITKRDNSDPNAVALVRSNPTVTDVSLVESRVVQINTFQSPLSYQFPLGISPVRPLVLREEEGFHLLQVGNDTSTYKVGLVWTERGL